MAVRAGAGACSNAWENANFPDVDTYEEIARIAGRGLLDFIFRVMARAFRWRRPRSSARSIFHGHGRGRRALTQIRGLRFGSGSTTVMRASLRSPAIPAVATDHQSQAKIFPQFAIRPLTSA
jgi:hypothetical protein